MTLKIKPKSFGPILVGLDAEDNIQYAEGNLSDFGPYPPSQSPVDTLIASLGSCIVRSVQWAADQRKINITPFTVRLVGTKSIELPGRVAQINITIIGDLVDDEALANRIVKQAKSICTVSNSLNSEVTIKLEGSTLSI